MRTVRMERLESAVYPGDSASATDPQLPEFLADLLAPYALPLRPEVLAAGRGHSYGEMAEPLVRAVATVEAPVDLLVLVYAIPDVIPGRATATYLSSICPGDPLAFAVCDQGTASPFTALAIAHSALAAGEARRALVLVVEQSALPYEPPAPVRVPGAHVAVGIVLSAGPGPELAAPLIWPDVGPEQAAALLAAELDPAAVLIAGAELDRPPGSPGRPLTVIAPADRPLTGVWSVLSDHAPDAGQRVVVAQYDPDLRYLCLANLIGES